MPRTAAHHAVGRGVDSSSHLGSCISPCRIGWRTGRLGRYGRTLPVRLRSARGVRTQAPGAEVTPLSCSGMVPPPLNRAVTVRWTDSAVACRVRSRPQVVQRTGAGPWLRVAGCAAVLIAPYGGRKRRAISPVTSATKSRARRGSPKVAFGPRSGSGRWCHAWIPISCPAAAMSCSRGAGVHDLHRSMEDRPGRAVERLRSVVAPYAAQLAFAHA